MKQMIHKVYTYCYSLDVLLAMGLSATGCDQAAISVDLSHWILTTWLERRDHRRRSHCQSESPMEWLKKLSETRKKPVSMAVRTSPGSAMTPVCSNYTASG
ncbi:MAG: hypothetical protein ACLTI1_06670 [Clostridia bacterium]